MSADEETIKPDKAPVETSQPVAPADEQTHLTEQDVIEEDARPFFFRHVTAIVKFCSVFLIAGLRGYCVVLRLFCGSSSKKHHYASRSSVHLSRPTFERP